MAGEQARGGEQRHEVNGNIRRLDYRASHKRVSLWDGAADGLIVRFASQAPGSLLFSVENMTQHV